MNKSAQKNRITLLMVEDHVLVRMALADYLRTCGYRVIEAATTDDAQIVLNEVTIKVDVLLVDAQASGSLDGFSIVQWVKSHRPDVKALMVGTPAKAAAIAGELCEEAPSRAKPFDPQLLHDQIRRLLAGV